MSGFRFYSRKKSKKYIDLQEFVTVGEFVRDHYTRPFDALPDELKTGNSRAQIRLPKDGTMWPCCRGVVGFGIYADNYDRASRGVKSVDEKKPA